MTNPSGPTINYTRDARSRITAITVEKDDQRQNIISAINYRPDNKHLSMTYSNGLTETRAYDLQGRLTTQKLGTAQNTTSALSKRWQYDANGNATLIDDNLTRQLYTYDFIDRLTVERASANFTYTYDGNDNRTTKTSNGALTNYEYTPQTNQLTNAGSQSITKDKAGNITNDGAMRYTWNDRNRLHTASKSEDLVARYEYDHTGFRTQKHTGDDVHIYHYDSMGRRIQHDINGKVYSTTLWTEWMPVAHLQHDSQGRVGSITWLTTDHLGTPRLGTNNTRQTVWRWTGDAFGTAMPDSDPDSNGIHVHIENRFAGQYRDNETGLHYNGFRHYSPTIGRYMSSDPIGLSGGMNTYGYADGNPLMYYDPLGLYCLSADEIENYSAAIDGGTEGAIIAAIFLGIPGGQLAAAVSGAILIPSLALFRFYASQSAQRGEAFGKFFSAAPLTPKSAKDLAVDTSKNLLSPEVANSLKDSGMGETGANMSVGAAFGAIPGGLKGAAMGAGIAFASDAAKLAVQAGNECECKQ